MFKDLPKSLIDAAREIQNRTATISELKLNKNYDSLDSTEKSRVRELVPKVKSDEAIVLDLDTQDFKIIKKKEFDKGLYAMIGEKNNPHTKADDIVRKELDKMGKSSLDDLTSQEKKELFNKVDRKIDAKDEKYEEEEGDVEDEEKRRAHGGDPQLGENRAVSIAKKIKAKGLKFPGSSEDDVITAIHKELKSEGKSRTFISNLMNDPDFIPDVLSALKEVYVTENRSASPEPYSAVGHRSTSTIKHADVIHDHSIIGGVKEEGYRVMYYKPNVTERAGGELSIFPSADMPPASSLEQLATMCLTLPVEEQSICAAAIQDAMNLPHQRPNHKGNEEEAE